MSKSQSNIPSPARSTGAIAPRKSRTRRTLSSASPAQAEGRLSTVVERFVKNDMFVLSPMKRRSVLPDDTDIEAPRRASWWKRLEGSSRDVLEALDTNKMTDDLLLEEYEFEVEKDEKQSQSVQQSQSSDNESVASIVVPHRRLFNQKKQTQAKFGDIMGSRKSLGKTNSEDHSIENAPKSLFNKGPRNKPVFPAALLNSTNKTINKTVEPETNKPTRPNLFGQAGGKRKNMFTDFVLSDSEEDSEVQHKVFGFKKNNNKRISLGTRNRRMPSLTPSMTTEIDIDDWNLLPSSTMIGTQENSTMSNKDMEQMQDANQDDTLTENNASLNHSKQQTSMIQNDENDKTLTNDNMEDDVNSQGIKVTDEFKKVNRSNTKLNESVKDRTLQNKSIKQTSNLTNGENVVIVNHQQSSVNNNDGLAESEHSLEDKMAQLHGESVNNEESRAKLVSKMQNNIKDAKTTNHPNDAKGKEQMDQNAKTENILNHSKIAKNTTQNESLRKKNKTQEDLNHSDKGQICTDFSKDVVTTNQDEEMQDISEHDTNEEVIKTNAAAVSKINSADAIEINQDVNDFSEKDKSEREASTKDQDQSNHEEVNKSNQDEDMDKCEEEVEPSIEEQDSKDLCEEAGKTTQNKNIGESDRESEGEQEQSKEVQQSEEEQEQSEEEQEQSEEEQEQSEEEQEQSEEEQEQSEEELEQSEEEVEQELSIEEHESPNRSDGATKTTQDHDMAEKQKSGEQIDQENHDEDMEAMVWNDNDDEKASNTSVKDSEADCKQNNQSSQKNNNTITNRSEHIQMGNKSINITNKSQKVADASAGELEEENDVVEETPNNSTHDTTGRNRNRDVSKIKSPEAVLQNMTNDNESFRPIGRSTTFRKSKSVYETMNMRHSLAPVQESTFGSEGSRNSSTEGSEWDSHRTTRKTIRQTLGKEYTTRKSLRALVMEESAKRQTEIYNKTSKFDKTKNKTFANDGNYKNTTKINKTKNKTLIEDGSNKNALKLNKSKNKTIIEDAKNDNASKLNKNKTILNDINDQHIRFRRTSNRNNSSNQSPIFNSPVHGISTSHVLDPLISKPQSSYHKSQYDIKDSETSERTLTNPDDSVNIPIPDNDSGPEISMNASYGEGMTASGHEVSKEISDVEMLENENTPTSKRELSRRDNSLRSRPVYNSDQEVLDYEASEQVISGLEDQENSEHDESVQDEKDSESENEEVEQSKQAVESEQEHDSQQEIELDSEQEETQEEIEDEESQEIEEQEQSQQEIESDQEESQEIEEQEQSQQEIESDQEESQEIEEQEQSHQEIESDQDESQEIEQAHESDQEQQSEISHDMSQQSEQEDDHEMSKEPENETDQDDDFISALNSEYKTPERRRDTRIVFDSNMMSVEEIDFEGVSRQSDNITGNDYERQESSRADNITGNESERRDLSRASLQRASEPSVHDVSVGTKRSMLLMKMEKIAQENMERRQKIRDKLQKLLKLTRNFPVQDIGLQLPEYSIRRPQIEPRRPKVQRTKPTGVPVEALPKAFAEDLMYKPPKRFQPANAPWITKRLYKFLETKLEAKYDYRARVRAEELVQTIFSFSKLVRRLEVAPAQAVDELKREMARLRVVDTHHEFYDFFHEFMPREIRVKVNPDVVNKIPMPRNGVFSDILQSRTVAE